MSRPNVKTQNQRDDGDRIYTRTDHMVGSARDIALGLIKQVAQMTDNSLSIDTRWFYYYKRRTVGRRCSCALGENSSPSSTCTICYNTGIVGGYDKYGTRAETVDSTYPELDLVNIRTDASILPASFVLEDDATRGIIRATIPVSTNAGYVDAFAISSKGNVTVRIRPTGTNVWSTASSAVLATMLNSRSIDLEVQLDRDRTSDKSPVFLKTYIRYGLLPKTEIRLPGDIPPNTESVSLQEYGYDEQFGTIQITMGSSGANRSNRITTFTIDDFLYYIERGRHWKITEVKPNYALGFFTSFDLTARWVQAYEAYKKFPI
jgi:hypothetical protein